MEKESTVVQGRVAESLAADYLEKQGLRVLMRNFRVRGGEIDLVCQDGATLVFVEVRLRTRRDFGSAADSITAHKRRRLVLAARHYLLRYRIRVPCRFDCILLAAADEAHLEWLRDAFSADD